MTTFIKTAGSAATTTLAALQWLPQSEVPTPPTNSTGWTSDLQKMNAYITGAKNVTGYTGSKTIFAIPRIVNGGLYFEGRGLLKINSGDWVVVDPVTGWPSIIPNYVFTGGSYVHS